MLVYVLIWIIILQLKRGDPVTEVEFDRSCIGCELRRIHRQADEVRNSKMKCVLADTVARVEITL